jgi:DNA-directed RNA polymerase specialized sigma24 family protein
MCYYFCTPHCGERSFCVSKTNRSDLRAIWRQLAQRNSWTLVGDETAFLDQVIVEFGTLTEAGTLDQLQRRALERTYSALLHRGLWQRDERAAQELWLAFVRTALQRGDAREDAEEDAQEAVVRALEKLADLRSPQSLLAWAFTILRTVRRERAKGSPDVPSLQGDEQLHETADSANLAAEVAQRLANQRVVQLLRDRLSNELERLVLLRMVLYGDPPRDVAAELGVPLHRARIAKHRALQQLRNDDQFRQILRDLTGQTDRSLR